MYMGSLTEDGSIGDEESNMWMMMIYLFIYLFIFIILFNFIFGWEGCFLTNFLGKVLGLGFRVSAKP
jgi:hypothetical protein